MVDKDKAKDVKFDKDGNIILAPDLYDRAPDKYHIVKSKPKK